jgi:hypothetical protein
MGMSCHKQNLNMLNGATGYFADKVMIGALKQRNRPHIYAKQESAYNFYKDNFCYLYAVNASVAVS